MSEDTRKFYVIKGEPDVPAFQVLRSQSNIAVDALVESKDPETLIREVVEKSIGQTIKVWADYKDKLVCVSEEGQ